MPVKKKNALNVYSKNSLDKQKPIQHTSIANCIKPLISASVQDAVNLIREIAPDTRTETRYIDDADGYILASPAICRSDMPGYDRSWKSGYAVIAADTSRATRQNPVLLTVKGSISPGYHTTTWLNHGHCFSIDNGCALPDRSDAVVIHEEVIVKNNSIMIFNPVNPGDNILLKDEDARAGDVIFPVGWQLRPQDIAVLAGFGICTVQVRIMPVIGIISTGTELVPADARLTTGEVRETNSYLISAICRKLGAVPRRYGIAWEGSNDLHKLLQAAIAECDAVIISGGSAHDDRDRTAEIIAASGTILLSGLSLSPRKTMVIGEILKKPVIGLPGHPASVYLLLVLVVTNLIQAMKGSASLGLLKEHVNAGVDIRSHPDREYHIPVRIINGEVFPISRKAGMVSILSQCDGIIHIPKSGTGIKKGDVIDVMDLTLLRSPGTSIIQ